MGGGIGGGVGIDNKPSPRRAAIEKAQAELRKEFVVREERRRELEFLEKGGNPLDFKIGEVISFGFQSPSPTDPLAEQYLTSEAKVSFALNSSPNGDSAESNGRPGTFLGRGLKTEDNLLLFAGDTEVVGTERIVSSSDKKGNVVQEGQTAQLDGNQIEPQIKEPEDSGGVRLGVKGQAYARRNRHKSNRYNGHPSLRDTIKVSAGDRSPTVSTGIKGLGDAKDTVIQTHADENRNVSAISISKSTSLNRNGVLEAVIHKNHLGTASNMVQRHDTSGDAANAYIEENHPGTMASAVSGQIQSHQPPKEVDMEQDAVPRNFASSMLVCEGENQTSGQVNCTVGTNQSVHNVMAVEQNMNRAQAGRINEGEKSLKVESEGSHRHSLMTAAHIGKLNFSESILIHKQGICPFNEKAVNEKTSMSDKTPESTSLDNVKEITASNYNDLHARRRDNPKSEDKRSGSSDIKIKTEEGICASRVVMQTETIRMANNQDLKLKGISPAILDKKVDSQSGGIISSKKGSMHPQPRVSSSSGVPSNKHAGVAEAESHKPNLSAAAKKAHEDIILDEAKAIKAKLKKNAEWAKANPFVEPPRRKSHWDFVLEEMAWMANDFMQERLWRIAAAAQVCRWVTQERGQTDFRARNLYQKQRKDACMLATAVMKYWQSAEALLCMEKHGASMQHGSSTSISQKSLNDGEAVAKEIDETNTIEVCNKDLEVEKLHNLSHLPIQEYCIRFLRDTKGSDFSVQAEAPSTPDRLSDAGILEPSWEDHFPEESLFYTTPYGAMEAYRNSVESYWASVENHEGMLQEENAEAWTDTDAQAGTEASDEALGPFKCGMSDFADDTRSHSGLSPHEISFGGDGRYLPGAFEGSKATKIARKKRKSIIKASMPKTYVGRIPAGESHGLYLGNNAETNASIPSPLTTGKRTLPSGNSNVGVIPTKRIRSSTVAARQRAAGSLSAGTTSALALATKTDASSGDTSSLQEEFNTFVGGSQPRKNIDIDPSRAYGKHFHFDGADVSVKYKKKKKSKHFGMGASSTAVDTAGNLVPSGKGLEYEQRWQQDSISQHEQREHIKRKGDSQIFIPSSVLGSASELQMTNSQGLVGQPAAKKPKLSKQLSDASPEAATPVTVSVPSPGASQMSNMSNPNKFFRMIANRDRGRKNKTGKAAPSPTGTGIPWSTFEDQALVVLVHDVGPNWELVSDIINASLQIKCIFRKPKDCKERHKSLMERTTGDGGDSPEDSGTSQPYPSTLPGIPKGTARALLQRLQGPMEEDALKTHFERIVQVGQRQHARKIVNDNQEQKLRAPVHYSHELAISQKCSNSLTGGFMTPLDLCDQAPTNTDMVPHTYQLQSSHASGLGMPNSLGAVSAVQPTSAEIPLLQGTCNLPLGTGLGASSAALNVAPSARDVQRFASVRPISGSMDEQQQQQRMQQYNHMVAGRSLQSPGISVSVGLPVGLPNSNDRGVRMLTSGNAAGMMSGLNRGMPLPRPGFPGVGSPGILSIASSGMSNMLPCSGVGLPVTCTVTSGAISGPGNMLPRSRDNMQMLQPGQSTEEQRQMLMQELQLQAAQGKGQPAASLNNLSNSFSNQMVSSPIQNFSVPHQIPQGHSNLHHSQLQNPNHNQQQQAYMIRLAKERQLQQHQRFLQQQQQFPANGTLLPQSQPHPLSQTQHTMPSMPNIPYQQQHSLPQHVLQQQHTSAQQQSKSQSPPTLQHQASQQSAASSMNPSIMQNPQKRQLSLSQTPGQSSQVAAQSNLQQNQIQKQHQQRPQQLQQQQKHLAQPQQQQKHQTQAQQQQHVKVSKGIERGSMAMQNLSAEPGHANPLQGPVPGNQLPEKGEQMVHLASGQRIFPGSGSLQSGKQMIQAGMAGQQGQGPGQAPISLSSTSTLCQQQKGFSQQSSSKQQTQISLPTENHQGSVPSPSSAQQQQQLPACQQHSSSVPAPPSASSSQQQQRQSGQPHQPIHRRLTLRQTGSDVGLQAPLQLGKNCIQQQDHVTSQLPSQPGQATFQTGAQMGCSLSTVSATPAVPLASAISSASTVHSAQRKPGQSIPQTTGAPYNASSNNSVSSTLISPVVNSSGTITSSNGNAVVPSPTTSGILSPGTGIGGLSQRQYAGSIGGHSVGALSAIGSRPVQQMGAQWHPQHPPSQQQQHGHNGTQSSTTNSVGSSYVEPPTSGPM
eukprot:Gb_03424 [translate_table: standard]